MFSTVEVRWFYPGTLPSEVLAWFQQGPHEPDRPPCRVDYYLRLRSIDSLGIKLREGRIELKQRYGQQRIVRFHNHVAGLAERWRKWSLALAESEGSFPGILTPALSWIAVRKVRELRKYLVVGPGQIITVPALEFPEQGCTVELTSIQADAAFWWTLGFEAFGDEASLRDHLLLTAEQVFAQGRAPRPLRPGASYGYPRWLTLLG
jgi:hypothetical protein